MEPQPPPEYKATPIPSTAPKLLTLELPKVKSETSKSSNKRKLQYNPENPGIESSSKIQKVSESPVYVPTPKNVVSEEEAIYEDIINCKDLKIKEEVKEDVASDIVKVEEKVAPKNGHRERRNSSSSSSSSKHKSSKSSKEKSSSSKKSSSRDKDRKDEERSSSSRKSSSRDKDRKEEKSSSSRSKSSKKDEDRDKDKSEKSSSKRDDKKSSRKDEERSSSRKKDEEKSSSSRSSSRKEKSSTSKKEAPESKEPSIDVASISYQSCEEDDIDEECRRIFEELKNSTKPKPKVVQEEPKIEEPKEYEDLLKKKRVAHEGSTLKVGFRTSFRNFGLLKNYGEHCSRVLVKTKFVILKIFGTQ